MRALACLLAYLLLTAGCQSLLGIEPFNREPIPSGMLQISPQHLNLGAALINKPPTEPFTFVISNVSEAPSPKLGAYLVGPSAEQLTVVGGTCAGKALSPGTSCTIAVQLTPTVPAPIEASLIISGGSRGGVQAELQAIAYEAGTLSVTPDEYDFGIVALDAATGITQLTVRNPASTTPSGLITARIVGSGSHGFAMVINECSTQNLNERSLCRIGLRYAGFDEAPRRASLVIASERAGTAIVSLTGTAAPARGLSSTPSLLEFSASIGTTSAEQSVVVTNISDHHLSALTANTSSAQYKVTASTCTAGLDAAASCVVKVAFVPDAASPSLGAQLVLQSGDNFASIPLSGHGQGRPKLEVESTSVRMPSALINNGSESKIRLQVWNSGEGTLAPVTAKISNTAAFSWDNGQIRFHPPSSNFHSAILTLSSGSDTQEITLSGYGFTPVPGLSFNETSMINFQDTNIGINDEFTTSLINNTDSEIHDIDIQSPSNPSFSIEATTCGSTLTARATCLIKVKFAPSVVGLHTADLSVRGKDVFTSRGLAGYGVTAINVQATSGQFSVTGLCAPGASCQVITSVPRLAVVPHSTLQGTFLGWTNDGCNGTGPCVLSTHLLDQGSFVLPFQATRSVELTKTGPGELLVISDRGGIVCGPLCTAYLPDGSTTVTAIGGDQTVAGWSGCTSNGATCKSTVTDGNSITIRTNTPISALNNSPEEDLGTAVAVGSTGIIYATGIERLENGDRDQWIMQLTENGSVTGSARAARSNLPFADEGRDLLIRGGGDLPLSCGMTSAASGEEQPSLLEWIFPPGGGVVQSRALDRPLDSESRPCTKVAEHPSGSVYALSQPDAGETTFHQWGASGRIAWSSPTAGEWATLTVSNGRVYALGVNNGDLTWGTVNASSGASIERTRETPVRETAVDLASTPSGALIALAIEDDKNGGSNVRVIEVAREGFTELRTAVYDSGPDSVDVATSLAVDPSGNVIIAGSSDGRAWLRKLNPTLELVWMRSVAGEGAVARDVTTDTFGNVIFVGDEVRGGQRDAFVRKIGP